MSTPVSMQNIRIAVISDLHVEVASSQHSGQKASYILCNAPPGAESSDPITDFQKLINEKNIKADILLCPGDLADKARPEAVAYAWGKLSAIAELLGTHLTIATAGNHDIDSRHIYNDYDAKGVLQELEPRFPINEVQKFHEYWSQDFTSIKYDWLHVLTLNSCAFHGGSKEEEIYGRVSTRTLAAIKRYLSNAGTSTANILLCHHHPHSHSEIKLGDADVIKNGQLLLDLLSQSETGEWIVIHGHKHHPKISYASGTTSHSPVVIAAGSFGAVLYPELSTVARNQFHIVELQKNAIDLHGLVGKMYSWDWHFGIGWANADSSGGIRHLTRFGVRNNVRSLARRIKDGFVGSSMTWQSVCDAHPEAAYLLPNDEERLKACLSSDHSLVATLASDGMIERIERV